MRFSKDHEWAELNGGIAKIGITDFAQHALGDIVFVEFPNVGSTISVGKAFGSVESVKAVSDLYAPISGKVLRINEELDTTPELLNENPHENWIIEIEASNPDEMDELMDKEAYEDFCAREA